MPLFDIDSRSCGGEGQDREEEGEELHCGLGAVMICCILCCSITVKAVCKIVVKL